MSVFAKGGPQPIDKQEALWVKSSASAEEHTAFFRYISVARSAKVFLCVFLCVSVLGLLLWVALTKNLRPSICEMCNLAWSTEPKNRFCVWSGAHRGCRGTLNPAVLHLNTVRHHHLWVARRMPGVVGALHATRVLLLSSSRCQATRRFTQSAVWSITNCC